LRDFDPLPAITYHHELVHKDLTESTSIGVIERAFAHTSRMESIPDVKRSETEAAFRLLASNTAQVHEGVAVYLSASMLNGRPQQLREYLSLLPTEYQNARSAIERTLRLPEPLPNPAYGDPRSSALDHVVKMLAAAALNPSIKPPPGGSVLAYTAELLQVASPDRRFASILDTLSERHVAELWDRCLQNAEEGYELALKNKSLDGLVAYRMSIDEDLLALIHRWCPQLGDYQDDDARHNANVKWSSELENYMTGEARGEFRVLPRTPQLPKKVVLSAPEGGFRFQWLGGDRKQEMFEDQQLLRWIKLAVGYERADKKRSFLHMIPVTKQASIALPRSLYRLPDGTLVVRLVHRIQVNEGKAPFAFQEVGSCFTVSLNALAAALRNSDISKHVIWHHLASKDPDDRNHMNAMHQPGVHIEHYDEFGSDAFHHVMKMMSSHYGGLKGRVLLLSEGSVQPCIAYKEDVRLSINCIMCPTPLGFEMASEISIASGAKLTLPLFSPGEDPEFDRITAGLHLIYIDYWLSKEKNQ
jgi:hypothetical protein